MQENLTEISEGKDVKRATGSPYQEQGKPHFSLGTLFALERSEGKHYWQKTRYRLVQKKIRKYRANAGSLLDIGCGNGGLMEMLRKRVPSLQKVDGMDGYPESLTNTRKRNPDAQLYLQDVSHGHWIHTDTAYDVLTSLDVLEHLDHPEEALRRCRLLLKPDGIMVITLPALHALWSERDYLLGHRLRYNKLQARKLLEQSGFKVLECGYLFSYLTLPMFLYRRLIASWFQLDEKAMDQSELTVVPVLNTLMVWLGMIESFFANIVPIPCGTSVYCIAEGKDAIRSLSTLSEQQGTIKS